MNKKYYPYIGASLILATFVFQLEWARSIPFHQDEGWWTICAKNMLLHHVRIFASWETLSQSPAATLLLYLWQALAGFGIPSARNFMLVLSVARATSLYLLISRTDNQRVGAVALAYLLAQFAVQDFSSSVFLEPMAAAYNIAALLLLLSENRKARLLAFVPITLGLATKITEGWIVVVCLVLFVLAEEPGRKKEYIVILFLSFISAVIIYTVVYLIQPAVFVATWTQYFHENVSDPTLMGGWLSRTSTGCLWFLRINAAGCIFLITTTILRGRRHLIESAKNNPFAVAPVIWLAVSTVFVLLTSSGRIWRFYSLFFPLAWLFARQMEWLIEERFRLKPALRIALFAIAILALLLPVRSMVKGLRGNWGRIQDQEAVVTWANANIPADSRALAADYLGANFQFPTIDLRDTRDAHDRFLPDSEKIARYDISYIICDGPEWSAWAKREGYYDDLQKFFNQYFFPVNTIGETTIWRKKSNAAVILKN